MRNHVISAETGNASAPGAADWLCLAATPVFAIMALLTGLFDGATPGMVCAATQNASPLSGMVPMYLLMSLFHAAPWVKLILRCAHKSRHTCHSHPSPAGP